MPDACDVLVVGAGPAGAVAAHVLASGGLSVVLADSLASDAPKVGESLPGAARAMLQAMGLLSWLDKSSPRVNVGNLSSWGSGALVARDFIFDPQGCGWHLDRARFDQCLREAAVHAGVILHEGRLRSLVSSGEHMQAMLEHQPIKTRWIIDASGRSRAVARRLGIARRRDASLVALYAWGENREADTRSVVEAVADGWWYTAGLPGGRRVVAFHVLPAHAAAILKSREHFALALQDTAHVRKYCAVDDTWSVVQGTDAAGSQLAQVHGANWIAVGDAALSFDPLSSQGMFNALYTGLRGAQAVLSSIQGAGSQLLTQYADRLDAIRGVYREQIVAYYDQERRWSHCPFWRSRHDAQAWSS